MLLDTIRTYWRAVHSQAVEDNVANHDLSSRIMLCIDLLPPRQRYCKGSAASEVVQKRYTCSAPCLPEIRKQWKQEGKLRPQNRCSGTRSWVQPKTSPPHSESTGNNRSESRPCANSSIAAANHHPHLP